ncbi:glucokinase [Evansella caseinilytica]|uniref:Glucokinase n=1 Tax=Evansella caseinilytica TaxID=1503961 RepID=A0A1H3QDZ6_9BACI|nr:ROK family protein [Evansella caseinilytica]SDZ11752.1 glucokinase [Evansella caseinilytica]
MYRMGIDIGGTNIRVGLFNDDGALVEKEAILTNAHEGVDAAIERLKALIVKVMENHQWKQVKGIGVGSPGPLDPWKGEIQSPPNLPGWDCIPLRQLLQEEYQLPVFLHNDANAAALGEYIYTYNREVKNLVYITVSTGIGGGVIADGRLMLGHTGSAAEIGHMIIRPNGVLCGCGNRGCLEAQASGTGIAKRAKELLAESDQPSLLREAEQVSSKDVLVAAQNGDALAVELLADVQTDLAVGIANIVHAYNPQKVIFGGGVMQAGDAFLKPVLEKAGKIIFPSMAEGLEFSVTRLGGDLGLYGAAALVDYFQET